MEQGIGWRSPHQFMEKGDTQTSPMRARVLRAPLDCVAPHSSLLITPLRMPPTSLQGIWSSVRLLSDAHACRSW